MAMGTWQRERYVRRSMPGSLAPPPHHAGAALAHGADRGSAEGLGCPPTGVRPPPGRWSAGAAGGGGGAGSPGAAAAAEQQGPAQQPPLAEPAATAPPADRIMPPPGLAASGQAAHGIPTGSAGHPAARPGRALCMAPPGLEHMGRADLAAPAPGRALEFLGGLGACLPRGAPGAAAAADRRGPRAGCAEAPPGIFDFGVCFKPEQKRAAGAAPRAAEKEAGEQHGGGAPRRVSVQRRHDAAAGTTCPAQGTAQALFRPQSQGAPRRTSDGGTFLGLEPPAKQGWWPCEERPAEEKLRNAGLPAHDLMLCSPAKLPLTVDSPAKLPLTVPSVAGAVPKAAPTPVPAVIGSAAKGSGARAVLWCAESTAECGASVKERCCGLPDGTGEQSLGHLEHLEFPVVSMFQRWIFQQERGTDVVPWAILVVGWREAQPCINHVEAAATEDFAGLRHDAQRHLRAATGDPESGEVRVAVSTAIIAVESWPQHARAASWIARKLSGKGAAGPRPVSIVLAHGRDDLRAAILAAAAIEGPQDAQASKAGADAEPHVPKRVECFDIAGPGAVEVGRA